MPFSETAYAHGLRARGAVPHLRHASRLHLADSGCPCCLLPGRTPHAAAPQGALASAPGPMRARERR
eukprot:9033513-Alexandrium_andersonii.AAC.1